MLTFEDCVGLVDLTEEEIDAIAKHEHITEMAALELGNYLLQGPDGVPLIKRMIVEDIQHAETQNNAERVLVLKATLKHFVETHPQKSGG